METSESSSLRYAALLQLLRTADTVWNASRSFFARWDISPAQFNVLNLLSDASEGLSQTELGRELLTHRSNVTGLVDRLEERGLVRRVAAKGDRRAWRVLLTEGGLSLWREMAPYYRRAAEAVWEGSAPEQAQTLIATLKILERNAVGMGQAELK